MANTRDKTLDDKRFVEAKTDVSHKPLGMTFSEHAQSKSKTIFRAYTVYTTRTYYKTSSMLYM